MNKANSTNLELLSKYLEENFTKLNVFNENKDVVNQKIYSCDGELSRLDKVFATMKKNQSVF